MQPSKKEDPRAHLFAGSNIRLRRQGRQGARLRARHGAGLARGRHRHRHGLRLDDPVGRAPARVAGRAAGNHVARLRAHRGGRLLRPRRRLPRLRARLRLMLLAASSPLTKIIPGLMIWTLVFFFITFYVLKRYAFGPVQRIIDQRRERIRQSLEEAEDARAEAHRLLEEHRKLIAEARGDADRILAEARRVADAQRERVKEETEADRQRRLEETRRQIEAETRRALVQIRAEVATLTMIAAEKVTRKSLDDADHRRLIDEAIGELDFSLLEREPA